MAKDVTVVLSHWHKLFEGFQDSPQRIYSLLDGAIVKRKIPNVKTSRIKYSETGMFSAKREYLRVRRKEHIFDICAAPFGTGFFVSWWLGETPGFWASLMLKIPIIGPLLVVAFRPITYYRLDTALMFQDSVHLAVLEIIEKVTFGKGVRALSELEKKPIMSDLFKRMVK